MDKIDNDALRDFEKDIEEAKRPKSEENGVSRSSSPSAGVAKKEPDEDDDFNMGSQAAIPRPGDSSEPRSATGGGQNLGVIGGALVGTAQVAKMGVGGVVAGVKGTGRLWVNHQASQNAKNVQAFTNNMNKAIKNDAELRQHVAEHQATYSGFTARAQALASSEEFRALYDTKEDRVASALMQVQREHPNISMSAYEKSCTKMSELAENQSELVTNFNTRRFKNVMAGATVDEQETIRDAIDAQLGDDGGLAAAGKSSRITSDAEKENEKDMQSRLERLREMIAEIVRNFMNRVFGHGGPKPG